ncbi:MAG TPA: single-stranded DNA-binding protein [Pyrinomonadaceae bacterium]|nr:single-stranded DNA-binding protein [Pyrinomonadaceae bacterium]
MSFNKIIIVGNLGKDPELRYTPQGIAVCDFSLATNEKKRDKSGEMQEVATWFRVTLWRNQAENAAKYLKKGSPVYIEGRLGLEEWTDRDGNTRQTLSVQASDMHFISSGSRNEDYTGGDSGASEEPQFAGPASSDPPKSTAAAAAPAKADDDIPF